MTAPAPKALLRPLRQPELSAKQGWGGRNAGAHHDGHQALVSRPTAPNQKPGGADTLPSLPSGSLLVQRKCGCERSGEPCDDCASPEAAVQRKADGSAMAHTPPDVADIVRAAGRPLSPELRSSMESAFGRDFSSVRIHTGATAEQSATALGAQAYTVGNHIVFGSGRYVNESADGQRLLAHELSHVVQQHGGGPTAASPSARLSSAPAGAVHKKIQIGAADDPLEHEADRVADHVMRSINPKHPLPVVIPQKAARLTPAVPGRSSDTVGDSAAPASVHTVIGRAGGVLTPSVRAVLEPAFGRTLGDVRIHNDTDAWGSAADVGARAYTVGSDVVFGSGQYDPATTGGMRLLAHEVAPASNMAVGQDISRGPAFQTISVNTRTSERVRRRGLERKRHWTPSTRLVRRLAVRRARYRLAPLERRTATGGRPPH
jgi:hypothetical protein